MDILFLFVMVIGFMLIGVPIAVSLGLSSIIFMLMFSDTSLGSIAQQLFNAFAGHYTLLAIPFFILASTFMSTGGVAKRIIRFAIACVGHMRGGLAMAAVFACMMFAALSGSSPATVVAIGSICIAGMRQVGYTKDFAAGVICNAGTLGILIPPSIVMVVYAASVDVSVGRMFLAGVIPGLLAGVMLMIGIYFAARWKGIPKQPWAGWGEVFEAMLDAGWGLFLIIIILGGIYGGVFTPTEAAAVAAVYAFLVAMFIYRDAGPLKGVPWLSAEERPSASMGFRVWSFVLLAAILYLIIAGFLGKSLILAVGPAVIAAMVFVAVGYLVHKETLSGDSARVAVLSLLAVGGTAALVMIGFGISADSEGSVPWFLFLLVAALICSFLPTAMMIYSFRTGAQEMRENPVSYGETLAIGAKALLRGLVHILVRFLPAFVHRDCKSSLFESGKVTIMLMFIIANALILKHVLTDEQVPQAITQALLGAGFGPVLFLVAVNVILLIGGQFMEPSGLIVIVAPLVFPIAIELGIDPIHLGIIMVVNMEIGMITPPVGLNLFVTSSVASMPMVNVVRAAVPWLGILFIFLIIVTYIPAVSVWMPTAFMGPELVIR